MRYSAHCPAPAALYGKHLRICRVALGSFNDAPSSTRSELAVATASLGAVSFFGN